MSTEHSDASRFSGPFPVVPTPFFDDESLDPASLERLVDRVLAAGVRGLTVLGSSSESIYLDEDERVRVLRCVAARAAGRATIIAGVIRHGTRDAVAEGKRLRDAGAHALMVALPQYYTTPFADVVRHYEHIVRGAELPTLYYHYPKPTHLDLTPAEVGKLFAEVALVGEKNSSLDSANTLAHIEAIARPIAMFTGQSFDLLACLRGGAVGCICPVALLMPKTAAQLVAAHAEGDATTAEAAQSAFYAALSIVVPELRDGQMVGVPHAGVKEVLVALGAIDHARVRGPQPGLSDAKRAEIRAIAEKIGEI